MTRGMRLSVTIVSSFAVILGTGCKKTGPASTGAAVQYTAIDPATAGTIAGVVHFDGVPPKRVEIDMAQDPACAMAGSRNASEQYVVHNAGMANVFVYVSSGLGNKSYAPSSTPVVLDQKGCRYIPHVIAAQVGQPVEFRNSDATMHNVHMEPKVGSNDAFDISQPPNGGTTRHVFTKAEDLIPVRCNNHPWMQAYINVAANPFFAVSDNNGHYSITGLPPGVYTLTAVQEQLGPRQANVTVTAHGTTAGDFHYAAGDKPTAN